MPLITAISGAADWLLKTLLGAVTKDIAKPKTDVAVSYIHRLFRGGFSKEAYLKQVKREVEQMPFLYKGIPFNVLDQSVDVAYSKLDSVTLTENSNQPLSYITDDERRQRFQKIVVIGDPGIGKTTFQRKAILSLISRKPIPHFIYAGESQIPIHVPLKLISNDNDYPILEYIRTNVALFFRR